MKINVSFIILKRILKIIVLIFLIGVPVYGLYFWYRIDKPRIIKEFQDPFLFNNGTRVVSDDDWFARREEIKQTLLNNEYGTIPKAPNKIIPKLIETVEIGEAGTMKTIILTLIPYNEKPSFIINLTLWLYIPEGTGPFPAIVKVSADGTGSQESMSSHILNRGYVYACFNHTQLDPDTRGYDIDGPCQMAYPECTWGSIGVWAWGAMRVADFLLGEYWVESNIEIPYVNPKALIITGHSRRGKTALLAGAMDERFALVVPNGSGCGGAGSFLVQGYLCETITDITAPENFRAWFKDDFNQFADNEHLLPFDQHFLRALVAPRIILSTDATEDFWANPVGTQAIYEATIPVFRFLGCEDFNAIHYRQGAHGFKYEDFIVLLDFADKMLLNKTVSGSNFYITPYDITFPVPYEALV
ncbi:MAG: hypothetical protein BAJALOKI2v1_40082 [Promethearchaeota archaeon]|nr:MAG: hypothetical protein BAJALOKI2v1_40082 [Candidatus Lokiarchaeota archaeon]